MKSFAKLEFDFVLRKELISYLNVAKLIEYQIKFNSIYKNINKFFFIFSKFK